MDAVAQKMIEDGVDMKFISALVLLQQDVGEVGAEGGVADMDWDDVGGGLLHPDPGSKQCSPQILDIGLVLLPQLSTLRTPQQSHGGQRSCQNCRRQGCREDES